MAPPTLIVLLFVCAMLACQSRAFRLDLIHWDSPQLRDHSKTLMQRLALTSNINKTSAAASSRLEMISSPERGAYVAEVFVGTPGQRVRLIIDSGSDLTWFKMNPSVNAYFSRGSSIYDFAASSSYAPLRCGEDLCSKSASITFCLPALDNFKNASSCKSPARNSGQCGCLVTYGSAYMAGYLLKETMAFTKDDDHHRVRYVMGGATEYAGTSVFNIDGILGLAQGDHSILKQLNWDKFSYCLVDLNRSNQTSPLIFGEDAALPAAVTTDPSAGAYVDSTTQSTPLIYNVNLYYVDLHGVYVNDVWAGSEENTGWTVFDSGSTLTSLNRAYNVTEIFASMVNLPPVRVPGFAKCFNISGHEDYKFPTLRFRFANGAELRPPQKNVVHTSGDTACLTVVRGSNVIGNIMQQNYHVLYDLKKARLSFRRAQCHEL